MSRIVQVTKKSKVSTVIKASPKTLIVSGPSAVPTTLTVYTHTQASPSSSWTVNHNLGYYPGGVSIVDSAGSKVYGDVTFVSENQLVVNFSAAFGGKAYVS